MKQVRRTRTEWEATERSVLCSEHYGGLLRSGRSSSPKFWSIEAEAAQTRCNPYDFSQAFQGRQRQHRVPSVETARCRLCLLLPASVLKLTRLSATYQKSLLESFHNVIIHFTPKSLAFSYIGIECRYAYYCKCISYCLTVAMWKTLI